MLIEIKHSDESKIEDFIKLNSLFLREFYTSSMPDNDISLLEQFNNAKTIIQEIKDKNYIYYLISYEDKNIGSVVLEKTQDLLVIFELFILKNYRNKGLSYKIIEEIKQIAKKNGFKNIKIAMVEANKKLPKIVEKWGFIKSDFAARYIGDDIYIYENVYHMDI